MDDQFNTTAGWVLGAGIAALGLTLLTGEYFKHEPVEKGGYHVEGEAAEGSGAAAELPIAALLQTADVAKGEETFKKCASCHTITSGGPDGIGPNLYGILGKKHGHAAGFAYSSGMLAKAGNWDFEGLNTWLKKPKAYVEGTKMSFAGLSNGADRANVIAYLNSQGSNLPMPAAPAAAEPAADAGAKPAAAAPAK
jgi:cytochrome c